MSSGPPGFSLNIPKENKGFDSVGLKGPERLEVPPTSRLVPAPREIRTEPDISRRSLGFSRETDGQGKRSS
jgi:hypothetical protein